MTAASDQAVMSGGTSETAQPSRWTTAAEGTRNTAKWLIGALAATATLIFGAGPIVTRPSLSWTENALQLSVAVVSGTVGLVALVLLIGVITKVLTPVKVTLSDIPASMRSEIDSAAEVRLPSGSTTYNQFLKEYRRYRRMSTRLTGLVSQLQQTSDAEPSEQNTRRLSQTKQHLEDAQANSDLYRRHAESYIEQAEYYEVAGLFASNRKAALLLAVIAALGALAFQLSLAATTEPASEPVQPKLAYLVSSPEQTRLWRDLALDSCAVGGKVPILLSSGTGADNDPYQITVVAVAKGCIPKTFAARATDATVEQLPVMTVNLDYSTQEASDPE